jgi:transglutaminase-like putative cysteine protease
MAGSPGSSARTQRLITIAATCTIAVVTAFALGRVFIGAAATWRLVFAALTCALLACACERRNLALAAAVSVIGLVTVVGLFVFHGTTWHGVPTTATVRAMLHASRLVGQQARLQVSPTPPLQPLMLAAVAATWAAVFSSHALAFRAGSPLLALVPPIALVGFADTVLDSLVKPIYGFEFLAAALLVIFADGIRRVQAWGPVWSGPGRQAQLSRSAGRGARRVAVAALGVAVMAPLLIPGFGSKALFDLSGHTHSGVNVDVLVSVASELKRDDPVEVFTVRTSTPTYYRLLALPVFDGATWRPAPGVATDESSDATLEVPGLAPDVGQAAPTLTQQFHVDTKIDQPYIPMNAPPVNVDMGVGYHWDATTGTATLDGSIDPGASYTVTSKELQPTPEDLRELNTTDLTFDPRLTELPSSTPDAVKQLAESWTDGAESMYDKVIAIQNHLLDKPFVYDASVPAGENTTALLTFLLKTRKGFCQQFSSSMAVLLRSIGIPARVVVGFTSGTQDAGDQSVWHVSTENAHAWVEVLFPTYGWLPFEPTPTRVNPMAESYANEPACTGECSGGKPHGTGSKGNTGDEQQNPAGKDQRFLDQQNGGAPPQVGRGAFGGTVPEAPRHVGARRILAILLAIAFAVFLLIPVVRDVRRRIRLRRAGSSPRTLILTTYDVFTERAGELGYARPPGETLDEYRARVGATGPLRNGDLDRLTDIASHAAYAPGAPDEAQAREATAAADSALRDLRKGTKLGARLRGRYLRER